MDTTTPRCENHGNVLAEVVRTYKNASSGRRHHVAYCAACNAERAHDNAVNVKRVAGDAPRLPDPTLCNKPYRVPTGQGGGSELCARAPGHEFACGPWGTLR